ncbi:MAG: Amidohydrolase domain protein, partial [uncultured Craurococcus sp.]
GGGTGVGSGTGPHPGAEHRAAAVGRPFQPNAPGGCHPDRGRQDRGRGAGRGARRAGPGRLRHRCAWLRGRAGPGRQPCPPGDRRLDPAAEPDGLGREQPPWRRHHHDLGRRGAPARAAERHRRAEGAGHHRPAGLLQRPPGRREGAGRGAGAGEGDGGERLRRARRRGRDPARGGRPGLGESGLRGSGDGRLGAQARHPEHHPYRRAIHPRQRVDRQGHGAGGGCRHHRPHQWRPYQPAGGACLRALRAQQSRDRVGAQRQRAGGDRGCAGGARPRPAASGHPRHGQPGGLGRATARHSADDLAALLARRYRASTGLRHGDGQHGAHPQPRCRADRDGAGGGSRLPRPGAAHGGAGPAAQHRAGRHPRYRRGDDRWRDALRPQPQHPAGRTRPRNARAL